MFGVQVVPLRRVPGWVVRCTSAAMGPGGKGDEGGHVVEAGRRKGVAASGGTRAA